MRSDTIVLIGASDVTLAVGTAVLEAGIGISCIITNKAEFDISYSPSKVRNYRSVDIHSWAIERHIPVFTGTDYDAALATIPASDRKLCLVAGWYHMVPRRFREAFELGCLGFHASLLPALRGGAPLNWAMLAGMTETGVSLFQLTDGVDDGGLFGQERFAIAHRATISDLVAASQEACAALAQKHLADILSGALTASPQTGTPSYSLQRSPADGRIDWLEPAERIDLLVRAVSHPYPGAFTELEGEKIIIWSTELLADPIVVYGAPGQIARLPGLDQIFVVTGTDPLGIIAATNISGEDVLPQLRKAAHKRFAVF